MANDILKKSLHVLNVQLGEQAKDLRGDNLNELIADAHEIRNSVQKSASSYMSTFSKIKSSGGVFNYIFKWFSGKESDTADTGFDEFDNGNPDNDNNTDEPDASVNTNKDSLNADEMRNITRNQMNAIYGTGGRLAELSTANTATIVKTINDKTTEITTSLASINKNILSISSKFDTLLKYNVMVQQDKLREENDASTSKYLNSLSPLSGNNPSRLSLASVAKLAGNRLTTGGNLGFAKSQLEMVKTMLSMSLNNGEDKFSTVLGMLMDTGFDKLRTNVKVPGTNGKSINQLADSFNKYVGAISQNALSSLIDSPDFKKLFGDINHTMGNTDYSRFSKNTYDTKSAVFDGMTRYSIINVIPEYLKKINQSLSGDVWEVNNSGELVKGQTTNTFSKVTGNAFQASGISTSMENSITEDTKLIDKNISSEDIEIAGKALTASFVMQMHYNGTITLNPKYVSPANFDIMRRAVDTLTYSTGKTESYWSPICAAILQKLSDNMTDQVAFANNVNASLVNVKKSAVEFAKNDPFGNKRAGVITIDMMKGEFKSQYDDAHNKNKQDDDKSKVSNKDDDSYLKKMQDVFIPKSIRISMQYFGNMLKGIKNTKSEITNKLNEKSKENNGDNIINSIKKLIQPLSDKIKDGADKVLGNKVTQNGETVGRRGGIFGQLKEEVKNTKNDFTNMAKNAIDEHNEKRDYSNIKNYVNDKSSNISEADKMAAQQVFALMESSVSSGSTSDDTGDISRAARKIKDPDLRSSVESSVMAMLKRSDTKASTKNTSLLGKLFTFVKNGASKLLSPIINIVKSGFSKLLTFGRKILRFYQKTLGSQLIGVGVGLKNTAQGLFGQKEKRDENGKITQEKSYGVIGMAANQTKGVLKLAKDASSIILKGTLNWYNKKLIPFITTNIKKFGKWLKEFSSLAIKTIKQTINSIKSKISEKMTSISNKISNSSLIKKASTLNQKINKSTLGKVTSKVGGVGDFLKGFTSVFKEASEAKKKYKENFNENQIRKAGAETLADVSTSNMEKMMTGSAKSLLSNIADAIGGIFKKITGNEFKPNKEKSEYNISGKTVSKKDKQTDWSSLSGNTESSGGNIAFNMAGEKASSSVIKGATKKASLGEKITSKVTSTSLGKKAVGAMASTAGSGLTSILGNIGKVVGGMGASIAGVAGILIEIVTSLSGFKELSALITDTVKNGFNPLNKVFKTIIKIIKPIMKSLQTMISTIVDSVGSICNSVLEAIQPILEAIQPIMNAIIEFLKPILTVIEFLTKALLAPLFAVVKYVVTPILTQVGNVLQVISGLLQIGMGVIQTALGGILTAIGFVIKILSFGLNSSILDSGKKMASSGAKMVVSGTKLVAKGLVNSVKTTLEAANPIAATVIKAAVKKKTDENATKSDDKTPSTGGSAMEGIVGNGDVSNVWNDNHSIVKNVYGSGNVNQGSFGSTLNMKNRGCGPTALADAVSRRSGKSISPLQIAGAMSRGGAYNPTRGTSVGGFINAGNSLGMNLHAGGVTRNSLKKSSASNPITLVGSGQEFGTKSGNVHYVNVVGADKNGQSVYISNPMTGVVSRRSTDGVVAHSIAGLYGSGDDTSSDDDDSYKFSDSIKSAMSKLSSTAGKLLSIFSTDDSTEDAANDAIDSEKQSYANDVAKQTLGDAKYKSFEKAGYDLFVKDNPREEGESADEYKARYEKVKDNYTTKAAQSEIQKTTKAQQSSINAANSDAVSKMQSAASATYKSGTEYQYSDGKDDDSSSGSSDLAEDGDGGSMKSSSGVKLGGDFSPSLTKNYLDQTDSQGRHSLSPLHEFFKKSSKVKSAYSWDYGWFNHGSSPNKDGKGSSGRFHEGVDIIYDKDGSNNAQGGMPIISTVNGKVVYISKGSGYNNGLGNSVNIKDSAGYLHRFMHMKYDPAVNVGDKVEGGKTKIGTVGTTGDSTCNHLHYDISKGAPDGGPADSGKLINPFTYFSYVAPIVGYYGTGTGKKVKLSKTLSKNNAWNWYKNKSGVKKFINTAQKVGMSGGEIATIAATGIQEDGGEKIFGNKSLTATTYDINGQNAVGIMNWVGSDDYGDTLESQLNYIHKHYFAKGTKDSRGFSRDDNWAKEGYTNATGRKSFKLGRNKRYGSLVDTDIIEGSDQFFRKALVPGCLKTADGTGRYVGTAAGAYNWLIDKGYIKAKEAITKSTKKGEDITTQNAVTRQALNAAAAAEHGGSASIPQNSKLTSMANKSALTFGKLYKLKGSGDYNDDYDIPPLNTNDYLSNTLYGNGDNSISSNTDSNDNILPTSFIDASTNASPINATKQYYQITPGDSTISSENIKTILANTYNVRSKQIESLLGDIIEILNNNKSKSTSNNKVSTSNSQQNDLFDEKGVPSSVLKLAQG